jgi:hypothetical protein
MLSRNLDSWGQAIRELLGPKACPKCGLLCNGDDIVVVGAHRVQSPHQTDSVPAAFLWLRCSGCGHKYCVEPIWDRAQWLVASHAAWANFLSISRDLPLPPQIEEGQP